MVRGRPRSSPLGEDLLQVLRTLGGTASSGRIRRELAVPRTTLNRRLRELVAEGEVVQLEDGGYRLANFEDGLTREAAGILRVLQESGMEAHLTGLDLLRPHTHQFTYQFPHLVYAAPGAMDSVGFDLASAGYVSQPVTFPLATPPELNRLVLMGRQSAAEAARLGVRGHIAPREKAWLDLLREALRGHYPIPLLEVGRILANLRAAGIDMERLARYAGRMRLSDELRAALGDGAAEEEHLRALAAGYRS